MKKLEVPWSLDGILLGLASFITFVTLTMASYNLYGEEFLEHAHLHHLSRQDTRHNFSVSTLDSIFVHAITDLVLVILSSWWSIGLRKLLLLITSGLICHYFAQILRRCLFRFFSTGICVCNLQQRYFFLQVLFLTAFSNNIAIFHLVHIPLAMPLEWFEEYWWCTSPATDRYCRFDNPKGNFKIHF